MLDESWLGLYNSLNTVYSFPKAVITNQIWWLDVFKSIKKYWQGSPYASRPFAFVLSVPHTKYNPQSRTKFCIHWYQRFPPSTDWIEKNDTFVQSIFDSKILRSTSWMTLAWILSRGKSRWFYSGRVFLLDSKINRLVILTPIDFHTFHLSFKPFLATFTKYFMYTRQEPIFMGSWYTCIEQFPVSAIKSTFLRNKGCNIQFTDVWGYFWACFSW